MKNPSRFLFHKIKIVMVENNHVDPTLVKKTVVENIHGGFFSLQVEPLHHALQQIPWIYDVALRRIWPDQLVIEVQEQKPIARWGNDTIINDQGDLFKPPLSTIPANLPLITGSLESQQELLDRLGQFNHRLAPLGIQVTAINLNARHAWSLILNKHIQVMLGRDLIDERLARLINSYSEVIGGHEDQVDRIDLRYPNGIAVSWKQKPAPHFSSNK